jgi:hypothetical protein
MNQILLNWAVSVAARLLGGITESQWNNIKAKVIEYEDKILPDDQFPTNDDKNKEKHKEVAKFIHNLVHTSSITVIDFLIKMALLFTRKYTTK